jgi:hypothetical protein
MDTYEARDEAALRTATYYRIDAETVRGARRALAYGIPCDLSTLAGEHHRLGTPEMFSLGRAWLARRGTPNMLVRPFVH